MVASINKNIYNRAIYNIIIIIQPVPWYLNCEVLKGLKHYFNAYSSNTLTRSTPIYLII